MWQALQNGWQPPEIITKDEYYYIKEHKDENPALTGFVGFGCSFGGKWFGGLASNKKGDNYCARAERSLMKDLPSLTNAKFICLDYRDVEIPDDAIVYCFDKETEVLTKEGWKLFKEVDIGKDLFLSREPNTGKLEWVKANYKTEYNYNGKMFHYKGRHIDLCITDNHNFYYAKDSGRKKNKIELIEKINNVNFNGVKYFIKAGGFWNGENHECFNICGQEVPAVPFARLLGIFITDGTVNKNGSISISQSKQKIVKLLEELFEITKIEHSHYYPNEKRNCHTFYIHRKYLPYFEKFYNKENRHVPDEIKNSNVNILKSFMEGTLDGDSDSERRKIYTGSKTLASDYQEILYKIGLASNLTTCKPKSSYFAKENRWIVSKKDYYIVTILKTNYPPIIKNNISWEDYNDMVYCVTLDKWHTVLTRRNGKTVWMGQCDPPYANTTGYTLGDFDHEAFWDYMRELSKTHKVFISEQTAPNDFECIWSKEQTRTLDYNKENQPKKVEKLFIWKG